MYAEFLAPCASLHTVMADGGITTPLVWQEAVGQDASSMEELMERVQRSVADGTVDSVTITVGTQVCSWNVDMTWYVERHVRIALQQAQATQGCALLSV